VEDGGISGLALILLGLLAIAQVVKGGALGRLNLAPEAATSSTSSVSLT
jgi:hypothetical protein